MSTEQAQTEFCNEVRLVGRLSSPPELRDLPSGDVLVAFRVVVPRPPGGVSKASVDALECASWNARVRRSAATWAEGDVLEVGGALRRRFFRTGAGVASRTEVEVSTARRLRRASSG